VYVRLHGPGKKYDGSYSDDVLAAWADRCHAWLAEGKSCYCYFDNDLHGYAPVNAARLQQMLGNGGMGAGG
jgi:uncharacterized protein YecE (DUF72 family)